MHCVQFSEVLLLLVTLYNKVSFIKINLLTNMNKQWTKHLLH